MTDHKLPPHVAAWTAIETAAETLLHDRKPAWKPGPDSKVRFLKQFQFMSADQFRDSLVTLGLNRSEFARLIRKDGRTIRLWAAGDYPVPLEIGFLLTLMIRTGTRPEDLG